MNDSRWVWILGLPCPGLARPALDRWGLAAPLGGSRAKTSEVKNCRCHHVHLITMGKGKGNANVVILLSERLPASPGSFHPCHTYLP